MGLHYNEGIISNDLYYYQTGVQAINLSYSQIDSRIWKDWISEFYYDAQIVKILLFF